MQQTHHSEAPCGSNPCTEQFETKGPETQGKPNLSCDFFWQELNIKNPEEAINNIDVKEKLKQNTENAVTDGVFGVPTFVVKDELFWGGDATDMMLDFLTNPTLFETSEMKRISEMPMGKTRKPK